MKLDHLILNFKVKMIISENEKMGLSLAGFVMRRTGKCALHPWTADALQLCKSINEQQITTLLPILNSNFLFLLGNFHIGWGSIFCSAKNNH